MMKNLPTLIFEKVVLGKEKAVVAFVTGAIGSFIARHGLTLDASLGNYLQALLLGLLGHLAVYFKANRK